MPPPMAGASMPPAAGGGRRRDGGGGGGMGAAGGGGVLRIDRHRRGRAGRGIPAGRRRHALQERDRGLHHDRARQRPQPAQRRFLLAARGGRRRDHCGRCRRKATLTALKGSIGMFKLRMAALAAALLLPASLSLVPPATAQQKTTIGVSLAQDDNPFYIAMLRGIRARGQELGWEVATVSANEDKLKQINGVQDLVARGVKG